MASGLRVRSVLGSLAGVLLAGAGLVGCGGGETAVARGDRLWADSNYAAALAEYRLALRQGGDEEAWLRVAHAFAETGQLERAQESYGRLLDRAPEYTDQAVFDYLTVARRALQRGDRYRMASAVEAIHALRPGLPVPDMAAALARYYAETGATAQALLYYEQALAHARPDSAPPLLYEMALIHEAEKNCQDAIVYFEMYRQRAPAGERAADARWRMGRCAFELAVQAREAGRPTEALAHLATVLALRVPEHLQDQAWFERGEALLALGDRDGALAAFRRVLELSVTRSSPLAIRARERIDQIRFGE